jgi:DUF2917 family protein
MNNELRHPLTNLSAGSMLRVRDGQGRAIVVFEGQVWITLDDDPRDIILSGGESFSIDRPGLTLVQALRDSKVMLVDADPHRAPLPSSFELEQWARERRSEAIGDAVKRGLHGLRRAVARAVEPHATPVLPQRLAPCTAVR